MESKNGARTVQLEFKDDNSLEVVVFIGEQEVSAKVFKPVPKRYEFFLDLFPKIEKSQNQKGGKTVGKFFDKSEKQQIIVKNKKGESPEDAMRRVEDAHNENLPKDKEE